jgi:hypothetical protein
MPAPIELSAVLCSVLDDDTPAVVEAIERAEAVLLAARF